ncbi:hypothetical protein MS3_00000436 [Schistosoma haematobium]|uniref:Reverse transcriptase domain-containing protein n=1 Tax=Schistosoma haematobium TaxID=6185 RepID=A0A922IMU8_SCHHA|nr:hypothetical protein MS3_00000436 [Schistosoma haematobium]KAH9583147.1 hypothetical protein MS3_00000436 [Schistosoma haematobium]
MGKIRQNRFHSLECICFSSFCKFPPYQHLVLDSLFCLSNYSPGHFVYLLFPRLTPVKFCALSTCCSTRLLSIILIPSSVLREIQADFRHGRGCIDHIFTIRQVLEHRYTYRRPTIVVFLDLKAAFDSIDREILWQCLLLKGVPQKCINLVKALYSNTTSRAKAYGEMSSAFAAPIGVRQGCPLSPFLFNFIIDLLMGITFSSTEFSGIDLLPGGPLIDLEYSDDIVLFGEDADKILSLLVALSNNARMFGMRFSPSKCKLLLQD